MILNIVMVKLGEFLKIKEKKIKSHVGSCPPMVILHPQSARPNPLANMQLESIMMQFLKNSPSFTITMSLVCLCFQVDPEA